MGNLEAKEFFNNLATHWNHTDKERDFAKKLIKELDIKKGNKVLDIACGDGVVTGYEFEESQYPVTGIDLSPEMIKKAKENHGKDVARFYDVDLFDFVEQGYDYAVMYNCYPHFTEPEKLSWKLKTLLEENGKVAIVHSVGRERLNEHHRQKASHISRQLLTPLEEAKFFEENFEVIRAEEDDNHFLLILKLK